MKDIFFNKERNVFLGRGRIRRRYYILSLIPIFFAFKIIEVGLYNTESILMHDFFLVFALFVIWINIGLRIMRSHDVGNSGWCVLIPFYGIWLIFANSEKGTNKYGQNPKGDDGIREF